MNIITIPEDLKEIFFLKLQNNQIGYMLLKHNKLKNELEIELEGKIDSKVEDLSKNLPSKECRIILFNFLFKSKIIKKTKKTKNENTDKNVENNKNEENSENQKISKNEEKDEIEEKEEIEEICKNEIIYINWVPQNTSVENKFIYSSIKTKVFSNFEGITFEYIIYNKDELTTKNIQDRIIMKTTK